MSLIELSTRRISNKKIASLHSILTTEVCSGLEFVGNYQQGTFFRKTRVESKLLSELAEMSWTGKEIS